MFLRHTLHQIADKKHRRLERQISVCQCSLYGPALCLKASRHEGVGGRPRLCGLVDVGRGIRNIRAETSLTMSSVDYHIPRVGRASTRIDQGIALGLGSLRSQVLSRAIGTSDKSSNKGHTVGLRDQQRVADERRAGPVCR